jgi:hypothetical protein
MYWPYFYWPVAVVLLGLAQGLLMPAIRRTPPGDEAKRQDLALHWLLTGCYFLALLLAPATWLVALLSRLVFFDPALNLGAGDAVFAVGSTARFDKALRWLAGCLSWPAERVRLVLWLLSVVVACLLLIAK